MSARLVEVYRHIAGRFTGWVDDTALNGGPRCALRSNLLRDCRGDRDAEQAGGNGQRGIQILTLPGVCGARCVGMTHESIGVANCRFYAVIARLTGFKKALACMLVPIVALVLAG